MIGLIRFIYIIGNIWGFFYLTCIKWARLILLEYMISKKTRDILIKILFCCYFAEIFDFFNIEMT